MIRSALYLEMGNYYYYQATLLPFFLQGMNTLEEGLMGIADVAHQVKNRKDEVGC